MKKEKFFQHIRLHKKLWESFENISDKTLFVYVNCLYVAWIKKGTESISKFFSNISEELKLKCVEHWIKYLEENLSYHLIMISTATSTVSFILVSLDLGSSLFNSKAINLNLHEIVIIKLSLAHLPLSQAKKHKRKLNVKFNFHNASVINMKDL